MKGPPKMEQITLRLAMGIRQGIEENEEVCQSSMPTALGKYPFL